VCQVRIEVLLICPIQLGVILEHQQVFSVRLLGGAAEIKRSGKIIFPSINMILLCAMARSWSMWTGIATRFPQSSPPNGLQ
jgi:hypothetical protein